MLTKKQILEEYKKCYMDKTRIYMIENYFSTFDATKGVVVPFKLFPKQKELLKNLSENINNITTKPRQSGISTCVSAFFAADIILASANKPETILIVANNLDLSRLDLKKIKEFLVQAPRWFWGDEYYGTPEKEKKSIFIKDNDKYVETINNSKIYARSSSPNSSRGISASTKILFDEASFIESYDTVTSAIATGSSSAKNIIFVSTPNGSGERVYYPIYLKAKSGENNFKLTEMRWYQDPRYNKNLKWIKFDKDSGKSEEYVEPTIDKEGNIAFDEPHWEEMVKQGFKPSSPWYVQMCNSFNHDKQRIAQELDVSFVGSAGNVVDTEIIEFHENRNVREPLYFDDFYKDAWIFKEPIEGHRYIMPVDASTGSGEDSSVIEIIDLDAVDDDGTPCYEQVFEYQGKIQGDILGELAFQYGNYYGDAMAIVDCVGSSGDACVLKLQELGYANIYKDDAMLKVANNDQTKQNNLPTNTDNQKLGYRAGYMRNQSLQNFEKMLRFNEIKIRSKRVISELNTWIWKNGRQDHQSGSHDDTITSMAMGLIVIQFVYKKLEAVKEKNKAILRSMIQVQRAMSGLESDIQPMSEKTRAKPLPFYTANSLQTQKIKKLEDPTKMMNTYLYNLAFRR